MSLVYIKAQFNLWNLCPHVGIHHVVQEIVYSICRNTNILQAIFRSRDQKIKTGSLPNLNLVSPERFDALLRALLTVLAAAQLLIPVLILFELQPNSQAQARQRSRYQILTIFAATLIFSASCSIFTKARKQEVFAATVAYCAVLVVFLGNASNVMTTSSNGP